MEAEEGSLGTGSRPVALQFHDSFSVIQIFLFKDIQGIPHHFDSPSTNNNTSRPFMFPEHLTGDHRTGSNRRSFS